LAIKCEEYHQQKEAAKDESENKERISNLQARRMKVLMTKENRRKIKSCTEILAATQSPFEIQVADEVDVQNQADPILRRIAVLTMTVPSEEKGIAAIMNEYGGAMY
jgi:restriction endonuclease